MVKYNSFGDQFLIEEFSGDVNAREFVEMKKVQVSQTEYHNVKGIVMDFRKARFRVTKRNLKQFFDWLLKNKVILENKSIAIITRTVEQLRFSFIFKDQVSRNYIPARIQQFSSKGDAFDWLQEGKRN
jgi:hypothetical protein